MEKQKNIQYSQTIILTKIILFWFCNIYWWNQILSITDGVDCISYFQNLEFYIDNWITITWTWMSITWPKGLLDPKIGDEMITHFLYLIFKDFSYWKWDLIFYHVRKFYLDLVISPCCAILDFWFHHVAQYKIWLFHHVMQYRNLYFTMLYNISFGDRTHFVQIFVQFHHTVQL